MEATIITKKTRLLADTLARERLGIGRDYVRPEWRKSYRQEFSAALRQLTKGATYYTAASFPSL